MNEGRAKPLKRPISPWDAITGELFSDIKRLGPDPDFEYKFRENLKQELTNAYNRGQNSGRRIGYDEGKNSLFQEG
jgi:hypothetical protein